MAVPPNLFQDVQAYLARSALDHTTFEEVIYFAQFSIKYSINKVNKVKCSFDFFPLRDNLSD